MFDSLKKFVKKDKFRESGFARLCKEDGIDLRELTLEEMQNVEFANFSSRLDRAGLFPKGYDYKPSSVDIVPTGTGSDKVNFVNLTFGSKESDKSFKINIKNFNVSTAKGDSLVYQHNKEMSQVWIDMCYALIWCQQPIQNNQSKNGGSDMVTDREISE